MKLSTLKFAGLALAALMTVGTTARAAEEQPYAFNVLNQRSVALTSQYWNPILIYVSKKSGVPLELKLAKTAQEGNAIAEVAQPGRRHQPAKRRTHPRRSKSVDDRWHGPTTLPVSRKPDPDQ